jgi:zinc transporter ZupT
MDSTIRTRPGGALLAALAAGAMLTMIAQTMLPEAYTRGGP